MHVMYLDIPSDGSLLEEFHYLDEPWYLETITSTKIDPHVYSLLFLYEIAQQKTGGKCLSNSASHSPLWTLGYYLHGIISYLYLLLHIVVDIEGARYVWRSPHMSMDASICIGSLVLRRLESYNVTLRHYYSYSACTFEYDM